MIGIIKETMGKTIVHDQLIPEEGTFVDETVDNGEVEFE